MTTPTSSGTEYTVAPVKYQLLNPPLFIIITLNFCGLLSVFFYLQIHLLGDLRQHIPEYVFFYLAVSILYIIACSLAQRTARHSILIILTFAGLFRLVLFFDPPTLSDDIYRYAWEGHLQTKGINPYRFPPDAKELSSYRNSLWEKVNNKDASAIYPPLGELFSAATFFLFKSIWGFKVIFAVLDGLVILALLKLLNIYGRGHPNIIFYAWNPLVVVEFAGSAHQDVLVVALFLWATFFCLTHRERLSVLFLAGSILTKFYPLFAVPFFTRKISKRSLAWLPLFFFIGYLPYLSAGHHLFSALLYYREKWRFNGFLFQLMSKHFFTETAVERILSLLILVVIWLSFRKTSDLLRQAYWVTGALLLSAPTLFPWYLTWMVPFFCFFPNPAWILLTITSSISYYVLIEYWTLGVWRQNQSFMNLEYIPFYILLVGTFVWRRLNREGAKGQI